MIAEALLCEYSGGRLECGISGTGIQVGLSTSSVASERWCLPRRRQRAPLASALALSTSAEATGVAPLASSIRGMFHHAMMPLSTRRAHRFVQSGITALGAADMSLQGCRACRRTQLPCAVVRHIRRNIILIPVQGLAL